MPELSRKTTAASFSLGLFLVLFQLRYEQVKLRRHTHNTDDNICKAFLSRENIVQRSKNYVSES